MVALFENVLYLKTKLYFDESSVSYFFKVGLFSTCEFYMFISVVMDLTREDVDIENGSKLRTLSTDSCDINSQNLHIQSTILSIHCNHILSSS